jgi:hypothetical protein
MSTIEPRLAYYKLAPDGIKHLQALERYLADCDLEKSLIELVKLRDRWRKRSKDSYRDCSSGKRPSLFG